MNKLIALVIAIGLAIVSAAHANGAACNQSCSNEHSQCLSSLGAAATGNCNDGFRVCVQRCDPRRMNAAYLDSDATRRMLYRRANPDVVTACSGRCALLARTCAESNNGRSECRTAQLACDDRCTSS